MFHPTPDDTKEDLANFGKRECLRFFRLNKITPPLFDFTYVGRNFGYYSYVKTPSFCRIVRVNLVSTRKCVRVPSYSWTFTGYKSDLTPAGVCAHECGHHLDHELGYKSKQWKKECWGENRVSGYEPNASESFAEAFRLFILNPNLLKEGRPKRYNAFLHLGILPLHDVPWKDILKCAHPKIINAAVSWIHKK